MNKFIFLLTVCVFSALLFSCATPASVTKTEFEEESEWLSASVSYPQFSDFPVLSRAISDFVEADFRSFKEPYEEELLHETGYKAHYAVSASYPSVIPKRYVSVLVSVWWYEGGAHGSTSLKSFVYDRKSESLISSISDLGLNYEEASRICRATLEKSLPVYSDDEEYRLRREEMIRAGTEPDEQNFRTFTYDGKTLTVYFNEYQVAPYSEGIQRVEIDWTGARK